MALRILIVQTHYPQFVERVYVSEPGLEHRSYEEQRSRIFSRFFGVGDAYSHALNGLGCEAFEVICNADRLQHRWALEHRVELAGDVHERRRRIVAAQVEHFRPDVLFVFEWSPLGDAFLAQIKPAARFLVGQIASSLPGNRTFAAYDLIVSAWPPIVQHFRSLGMDSEYLRLAFDARVSDLLGSAEPAHDVTFVGGFAPAHTARVAWLEALLEHVNVDIYGYGVESVPRESAIHAHYRGEAWGLRMYEILRRSRITLNLHARIAIGGVATKAHAANMRLYEATGVGCCLVTDDTEDLHKLFEPGREVAVYRNPLECAQTIKLLLEDEARRDALAKAGQRRTLAEHTYPQRLEQLLDMIHARL